VRFLTLHHIGSNEAADKPRSKMKTYHIRTDAFSTKVEATNLNAAIKEAFDGEIKGVTHLRSLKAKFKPYAADGGWCFIEVDGERVVEIGSDR
jgi:hypothetical protein